MTWQLDAAPLETANADWLIVGVTEGSSLSGPLGSLDAKLNGQLTRLKETGDLTGKFAEIVTLRGLQGLQRATRLVLVGLGKPEQQTEAGLHRVFNTAIRQITTKDKQTIAIAVPPVASLDAARVVQCLAAASRIGGEGQDLYRTERQRFPLENVQLLVENSAEVASLTAAANAGDIIGEAVNLAQLVNQPPSVIYPISFAARAQQVATECGLTCEVFDEHWMKQERMNAFLAVSQGSSQPPRLVVLEYNNAPAGAPTLTVCGKGVTFDSGGLSIKPTDSMLTMKCDMAGAATVLGLMQAIAKLKLPVHVRGMMGLTENMPGASAFKLGDVMVARNGVTIENQNSDAEGRLVLADVLSYAVDRGTDCLIDLATLTGACVVALGEDVVGAFTNNQAWCDQFLSAALKTGEDAWQMPMHDLFNELIKSDVADIRNIGGRWGGAITAAKFLERFVSGKPWIHLDIAGPAFASTTKPHREGGATGVMVKTLIELVQGFQKV